MNESKVIKCVLAFIVGGFIAFAGMQGLLDSLTRRHFSSDFFIFALIVSLIGYTLLAYIPCTIAGSKGQSKGKWFVYGFIFFPIAFVHSLMIKDYAGDYKECPYCAERVKKAAKVCRYCGKELTGEKLAVQ